MIELQTSVKQDDTTRTRTRTPKPGYLNLSIAGLSHRLDNNLIATCFQICNNLRVFTCVSVIQRVQFYNKLQIFVLSS
jgi:hypothetical protein